VIAGLRRMWAAAPIATAGLGIALLALIFFSVRLVVFTIYWSDPAHRDEEIAGWMSPRYIANSWHVPPEVVGDALGLAGEAPRRVTLNSIAAEHGTSVAALTAELETAIAAFRETERR